MPDQRTLRVDGLVIGEMPKKPPVVRLEFDRSKKPAFCLGQVTAFAQDDTEVIGGYAKVGIDSQCRAKRLNSPIQLVLFVKSRTGVIIFRGDVTFVAHTVNNMVIAIPSRLL